jgi:murein DD-endopeptidase MepM/ murein hydrolase activator NlpD
LDSVSIANIGIEDLDMRNLPLPSLPQSGIFQEASSSKSKSVFPIEGRISSRFGHRSDPINGHDSHHKGLDIAAKEGTSIKSMRSGTVTFAGTKGGYGKLVVVDHGNGLESRYAHCSSINVRLGQRVSVGAPIAAVGTTGRSTGPHLHLEVRKDGHAVDPMKYLKSK